MERSALMKWIGHALFFLCLELASNAQAVVYLTQEQALALAFESPTEAKKHPILIDHAHRKAIEQKLGEKSDQRGVLAFTGRLKSGENGAVLFDSVIGKHELIDYMVVLNKDAKINFVEILAYRESYGGEIRRGNWREQFRNKSDKEPPEHENNIINISGATLSCRHVTEGVRKLLTIASVYAEELGIPQEVKNEK